MCTLTWTAHATGNAATPSTGSATDLGYRLWFNRDEQLSRAPEVPPRKQVTEDGTAYIAPEDSEAGGTWLTANEYGVTVALLNGYVESRAAERSSYTSRGVLVRSLAGIRRPKEALAHLAPKALACFRPAVIVIKAPGQAALIVRWDGLCAAIDFSGERQLPLTSSSHAQDEVQRARRALYRRIVLDDPNAARLSEFQNYVDPEEGPTNLTPVMRRSDAATRSQCVIDVAADRLTFEYAPISNLVAQSSPEDSVTVKLSRVGR